MYFAGIDPLEWAAETADSGLGFYAKIIYASVILALIVLLVVILFRPRSNRPKKKP